MMHDEREKEWRAMSDVIRESKETGVPVPVIIDQGKWQFSWGALWRYKDNTDTAT